ncbi:MAG: ubiquinol-cytochrome c reductase iron-sulfur subunit [Betaproteobacteria bacterium RIFCSPHIGHO2_12_FULL_69_13]|nr:MAG: ubiquinol-cytochrome c reductase iron-sulfur subunit [Betaproteobacteria bacterium RIFCSPHIGHO2_12_FULL_69_13]OGA64579.1 MAG: ubiquinol-cytochrome c reductase iron-sulfur subunit [Betaproteobacteria bacterium RIFCSPLOWO2_12_FULL_68_20]
MSDQQKMDKTRRNLLVATSVIGGAASVGAAVPFAASMWPSERAKAVGAPVEVDVSRLAAGELAVFEWRGTPVWVMKRTQEMLAGLKPIEAKLIDPKSEVPQQPEYAKNEYRSVKPELMVVIGVCTHLGCIPQTKGADAKAEMGADWTGGFYCPCHGSKFDLAGRVYKGSPAPTNLVVPPYTFVSDDRIVIGEDRETKGA